jgi:xanthine phosphoribosyltransferase
MLVSKITWIGVERLLQDLHETVNIPNVQKLCCISRGGLVLGGMIAKLLDIRDVGVLSCAGYEGKNISPVLHVYTCPDVAQFNRKSTMFIDDIADTGRTMNYVAQVYPNAWRYTLVAKPEGMPSIHACSMTVEQNCWVEFPWEIKKGARLSSYAEASASSQ